MTDRRQQDSRAGKQRGDSPADDNPEPQGFWARVWVAFTEEVLGDREPDGGDAADDSSEPRPSGLWERLKSRLYFDDEDEDRPWIYDYPYHWKYFRTYGRDLWADAIVLGLVAAGLAPLYFYVPHVRPVVDKTATAAYTAVKNEIARANLESARHDRDYYSDEEEEEDDGPAWGHTVRSVMTGRGQAEAYAGITGWLGVVRPGLSVKRQGQEIQKIDAELARKLQWRLLGEEHSRKEAEPTYSIRSICQAGSRAKPWLALCVVRNGKEPDGYSFAVYWRGDGYRVSALRDEEDMFITVGKPALQVTDLDMDGTTELVETWHTGEENTMLARVYRLDKHNAWACLDVYPECVRGELKLVSRMKDAAPQIAITEDFTDEDEEEDEERAGQPRTTVTSVFAWDRKSQSLVQVGEYMSEVSGI